MCLQEISPTHISFIHAFLTVIPKQKVNGKNHLLFIAKADIEDHLGMIIILCMLDEIVGLSGCSLSPLVWWIHVICCCLLCDMNDASLKNLLFKAFFIMGWIFLFKKIYKQVFYDMFLYIKKISSEI